MDAFLVLLTETDDPIAGIRIEMILSEDSTVSVQCQCQWLIDLIRVVVVDCYRASDYQQNLLWSYAVTAAVLLVLLLALPPLLSAGAAPRRPSPVQSY